MRNRLLSLFAIGVLATLCSLPHATRAATTGITLTPGTTTVASGHALTFVVSTVDSTTSSSDVTSASALSTNDPSGTISGATYTGGKVGSWTVQASYQSFVATATVTVTPGDVAEVVVNPNSDPEVILTGTKKRFSAQAFDRSSNIIDGATFTWSVIGPVGSIDDSGVFTPSTVGTGKVQAMVGTVTGQVAVSIQQAPVSNTNTSVTTTNTTTNQNTNTTKNTNMSVSNTNTSKSTATNTSTSTCTTLKTWVWTLILVVFLVAVAVLYGFVPVTKIWPVAAALIGAAVLAYVQRKYDCSLQNWWAWVVTLGTVALSALAIRSTPMNPKQ